MGEGAGPGGRVLGTRIHQISDGTSNTLLVVEGESAVPWTKPVDIPYSAAGKLPQLGGLFPDVFHAALADGSTHAVDKQADETVLRRLITPNDGHVIDRDSILDPVLTDDPEQLRRENRQLEAEIARAVRELADLKRQARQDALEDRFGNGKRTQLQFLRAVQKHLLLERDQLRSQIQRLREQRDRPDSRRKDD
jgi:hypothetical protein